MASVAAPGIPRPIAASNIMIFSEDGGHGENIPDNWKHIRFDAVDVLAIHGFSTSEKGEFMLGDHSNKLDKRLEWVLATAKAQNSNIKFFAQQNFTGSDILHKGPDFYDRYADSVVPLLEKWGLHGYDIDYEPGPKPEDLAILQNVVELFKKIHSRCAPKGYLVSITPAQYDGLFDPDTQRVEDLKNHEIENYIDLVVLQTYDGGISWGRNLIHNWLKVFPPNKILISGNPEQSGFPWKRDSIWSVQEIIEAYMKAKDPKNKLQPDDSRGKFAGIHVWRLNSDVFWWENAAQVMFYNYLHRGSGRQVLHTAHTPKEIAESWYLDHHEVHKKWSST
ncbi:Glycoside hydrolase superfamily [Rhypophila sp. PSN 637]